MIVVVVVVCGEVWGGVGRWAPGSVLSFPPKFKFIQGVCQDKQVSQYGAARSYIDVCLCSVCHTGRDGTGLDSAELKLTISIPETEKSQCWVSSNYNEEFVVTPSSLLSPLLSPLSSLGQPAARGDITGW